MIKNPDASAIIAHVTHQIGNYYNQDYRVDTDLYQGPLDILLELIESAELDIDSPEDFELYKKLINFEDTNQYLKI
mgnify:CR=1 FL=1